MAKEEGKEEKQVPEKPKKKSGGGDFSLKTVLIAVAATVALLTVALLGAFYMVVLPEVRTIAVSAAGGSGDSAAAEVAKEEEGDEENKEITVSELKEEDVLKGDEGLQMIETGRIITNPKNSTKFAVINLTLEFRISERDERFASILGEGGGGEGGGGGENPLLTHPVIVRLMAQIKDKVLGLIGSMTIDEIYSMTSDDLATKIKDVLYPVFLKNKLFLKNVLITEKLIQ